MTITRPDRTARRAPVSSAPALVATALAAGLAADVALDPHQRHIPLCPLHALTGIWCPLCGGLRAADSLAHGQFVAALHENVLFIATLPLLFAGWLYWLLHARSGRPLPTLPRTALIALVTVAVGFTIVRNLPFVPGLRGA